MECNRIKIAGRVIQVTTCTEGFGLFAKAYLTENTEDLCVGTTQDDIEFERKKAAEEDKRAGNPAYRYPDSYLETLAVYRKIAARMLQYDTLLMHGSAVAVEEKAYLFIAASGTGKSTHTRLWREVFGARVVMVNDDKPLVRADGGRILVCGTPWDGKHHLSTPTEVELAAVCILERGVKNEIERISVREALPMLLQQSYRPTDAKAMDKMLQLVEEICRKAKLYRLRCNMEPEAARTAYEMMSKDK